MKDKKQIETCFSPLLFPLFEKEGRLIIVADIFRATTSICAALDNGAKEVVAISGKEECLKYKEKGFIIAGEREGKVLDYADMGNSPDGFITPEIKGKSIVLNSTNGTRTIKIASENNNHVVIGAFVNLNALVEYIIKSNKHILLFCSGWKDHFSLEDSLFAGALSHNLFYKANNSYSINCDATKAAIDIWKTAKSNPRKYIDKASHRDRLKHMNLDHVIDYCMSMSIADVIPVLQNQRMISSDNI